MIPKNTKTNRPQTPVTNLIPNDVKQPNCFKSAKSLNTRIDWYFNKYIKDTEIRPNVAGLAWFLGFKSKDDLMAYIEKPARIGFRHVLKRALLKIEEVTLSDAQRNNIGSVFYSKAQFGYVEKQVLEIDAPPSLSPEDRERLRRVADLWEKERRKELGSKVQDIKSASVQS